ncbi:MAG: SPOR domain-containing protein [Gammaproteobacteria bacterium]|jgi:cell division protein FtsN|nr:SPOR domain-containing protein [Gammaproteobacteria bacterium]MBU0787984.1 SPOR domain-containing protein [Gammaproteobacteria bacterium]MBU0815518.1 SPOR domain-containing protein [Gammaproteobacteria bacterium]MBU1785374.1 SPOR domain-containing protein [Gammaproteobacteria bacterium]
MKQQRGGTFLGFVIGVVVGLAVALGVAVYITKVPIPFVNKASSRTAEQDAAETKKNKDWDPNAPLHGKSQSTPGTPGAPGAAPGTKPGDTAMAPGTAPAKPEVKPAVSADPLGDLVRDRAGATGGNEPFSYFVQVGAFRTPEDAESQRAKLSLAGVEAKVTEREQAGRTVYRVRVGPFDKKEVAEKTKEKLDATGLETALVRVQR